MQQATNKRSSWWGALAGAVGGLCCIGPSAAVLLGLGSSSALAGFTLNRNITLGLGGMVLAVGVAMALRHAQVCELPGSARWRTPALMLAAFVLSYAVLGVALPRLAAWEIEAGVSQEPGVTVQNEAVNPSNNVGGLRRAKLIVTQMECPPCASHVRSLLKRKPFVRNYFAEPGIDQVTIDYDSGQITPEALAKLIPLRYGVTVVSDTALQ